MTVGGQLRTELNNLSFKTYTADEIRKLSVISLTKAESLDALGHPVVGGVYDLRLGKSIFTIIYKLPLNTSNRHFAILFSKIIG